MFARVRAWLETRSPRQILTSALVVFLVYAWPGFIGWDSRQHLLDARNGDYSDAHPPAIARLWRVLELVVAGPAGMLLVQAITLLAGLFLVFRHRLVPRAAAYAAAAVFLLPLVSGVTGLICKDALMAGFMMLGIGLVLDGRTRWGVAAIFAGTLMRWNSFPATFAPVVLLVCWRIEHVGWRRYAIALATWLAITIAALGANALLATKASYSWYGTQAYQDIAGTLEYVDELDDATLAALFAGVPLREHDRLHQRFRDRYNPADYRHLIGKDPLFDKPITEAERTAVTATWRAIVLGHPSAYLRYRVDNFQKLIGVDRSNPGFSNVYIWFTVIAAPETIPATEHDATASRVQAWLGEGHRLLSLTPLYFVFIYFALCFALLAFARRLELALLLGGIGYELSWFFTAPTSDFRYSQWMILTGCMALVLVVLRRRHGRTA